MRITGWRRWALEFILFNVIALILLRLVVMTPIGHALAVWQVERMSIGGQSIELSEIRGDLLGRFEIGEVTISDADGIWLSADALTVRWSPRQLLNRTLLINQLDVMAVEALREPKLSASQATDRSGGRTWQLALEQGDVDRLLIDQNVFGRAQALKVGAVLETRGDAGTAQIRLEPLDSETDLLDLAVDWAPDSYPVGRLQFDAKAGGLITSLLRTEEGADLLGSFDAGKDSDAWTLEGTLTAIGRPILLIDASASPDAFSGDLSVDATGFGYLAPISRFFSGPLTISLSGTPTKDAVPIEFAVQADESRLSGRLIARQAAEGLHLSDIDSILEPGRILERIGPDAAQIESILIQGELSQTQSGVRFLGQLNTQDAIISGQSIEALVIDVTTDYADGALAFDVLSELSGIEAAGGGAATGTVAGSYRLETGLSVLQRFSLESDIGVASGSGSIDRGGAADLNGLLRLESIGPVRSTDVAWALQRDASGSIRAQIEGPFELQGVPEAASSILGQSGQLRAELRGDAGRPIKLEAAEVSTGALRVDASGDLTGDSAGVRGRIATDPLAFAGLAASAGFGQFELLFPNANATSNLQLEFDALKWQNQKFNQTLVSLSLRQDEALPFALDLTSSLGDLGVVLGTQGRFVDQEIDLHSIAAAFGDLSATGSARVSLNEIGSSSGQLNFGGEFPGGGSVSGKALFEDEAYEFDARLSEVSRPGIILSRLNLSGRGDLDQVSAEAEIDGDLVLGTGSLSLDGHSGAVLRFAEQNIDVELDFQIADQEFRSESPIQIAFGSDPKLEGNLSAFGGRISLLAELNETPQMEAAFVNVAVAPFGRLIGRTELLGLLNGRFDLHVTQIGLSGLGEVEASGLKVAKSDFAPVTASFVTDIQDNAVSANMTVSDPTNSLEFLGATNFSLQGSSSGWTFGFDPSEPVRASLAGSGDISQLWRTFGPAGLVFGGVVELDLSGEGLLESLHLAGPVRFQEGVFEHGVTGLGLKSITLDAFATRDSIFIRSVQANGWNGGSFNGAGHFGYDRTLDVQLQLQEFDALNRDDLSANVSGPLSIVRTNQQTAISGQLALNSARLDLSRLPRGGFQTLNVNFEESEDVASPPAETEGVQVDIGIAADRRLFVVSPQLESEWGLALNVGGTTDDLQLNGRADLVRGSVELLTNTFRLTDGIIRFGGDLDASEVDLRANQLRDNFETEISLNGDLLSPSIELSSNPVLPEEEILSRLLFGRSAGNLSGFEAAQLASAAAALASGGSGLDVMGSFRNATGLDRLSIGETADGSASLTTGKYIADNVYLEIETGASGTPALDLEWTPLESLQIDTQLDPEIGPRLSVQWRRDFDRLTTNSNPTTEPEPVSE